MANALSYIKNVGKSVSYATIDVLKDMNPAISDFGETNADLIKDVYTSVKKLKSKAKDMPTKAMESQYGQFAKTFRDNLFDDLKTGKFYNRERKERYETEAASQMLGMDDDSDSGFDFDFGGDDDDWGSDISSNDMMDLVGEKASNAVATAVARSSEYIMRGTGEIAKAQYDQLNAIYGGLHSGMGTMNKNLVNLVNFANESVTTHFNNAKTFYESVNAADEERNRLLKDILENVKELNQTTSSQSSSSSTPKGRYSDIASYSGSPDLSRYGENIKKNLKNKTEGVSEFLDMLTETGALKQFAASPLEDVMTFAIKKTIPQVMKTSMEQFNKSLNGLFGTAMMKLSEKSERDGGIWETINDIFGVKNSLKNSLDPSKYEKGRVSFDGVTRKAIVEVIPTYLSKIYSAISGKQQDRYDYDKGKFVSVDDIRKEFDNILKNNANYAAIDLDSIISSKKDRIDFKSKKMQDAFDKDWEAMKEYMFRNKRVMNTGRKYKGSDFGLKGGLASDLNVELIRQLLDKSPEMLEYSGKILQARDDHTQQMNDRERKGDSIYAALQNGSISKSTTNDTTRTAKSPIHGIGNGIIDELRAIHKEISYIRTYGIRGDSNNNKNTHTKSSKIKSFDEFDIFSNTKTKIGPDNTETDYDTIPDLTNENISDKAKSIIKSAKLSKEDKEKLSFSQQMTEAQGLSAKMAVIANNAKELASKPGKFIASVFDRADERLYDLIYGPKEDKSGNKSFVGRMFNNLDKMFNTFAKFIDDTIINPLKGKFNKENVHEAAKKVFGWFGIDIDSTMDYIHTKLFGKKDDHGDYEKKGIFSDLADGIKYEFGRVKDWFKSSFGEVFSWFETDEHRKYRKAKSDEKKYTNQANEFKEKAKAHRENESSAGDEYRSKARDMSDNISATKKDLNDFLNSMIKPKSDDVSEAATGLRRVNKTGLAVISEGEMVIPPDMNPFNIQKRKRAEKKVKDDVTRNGINADNIVSYAKGTAYADVDLDGFEQDLEKQGYDKSTIKSIMRNIRKRFLNKMDKADDARERFNKAAFGAEANERNKASKYESKAKDAEAKAEQAKKDKENSGYTTAGKRLAEDFIDTLNNDIGIGKKAKKDTSELKKRAMKILDDAKESLPSIATGASIGAGLSLLTGFVGGPLVGAAVGSAVGLAKNSESFQEMLFGNPDETGNYSGGIFSKKLSNAIKKYMPDMSKSAAVGGFLTSLPFIPGGPIAGIIAGSAIGFAKNNEDVQNALFGEGKLFKSKEEFKKKVESVAPKMGVGAAVGLLAGPFGLTTNILLGSALGFASDTDKFKDIIFGEKDEDGNRTGGIFNAVVDPAKQFFKDMYSDFRTYMKEKVFEPLKDAFEPITRQVELMFSYVTNALKEHIKLKVGQPLERLVKRMSSKVFSLLGPVVKTITAPVRAVATLPIKAIQRIGDASRVHQVKTGGAKSMSAAARNAFRQRKGIKMGPGDQFKDFDESLANMDYDQISSLESIFGGINQSRMKIKDVRTDAYNNIRKSVWGDADPNKTIVGKEILKMIKKGYYEDALRYLDKVGTDPSMGGLTQEQKDKLRKEISYQAARMKNADNLEANRKDTLDSLYGQLSGLGMKLDKKTFNKIANSGHESQKILDMLNYEKSLRGGSINGGPGSTTNEKFQGTPIGELNKQEEQRHRDVINSMNTIVDLLKKLNNITDTKNNIHETKNQDFLKNQENRFNWVGSKGEDGEENDDMAESSHIGPKIRHGVQATRRFAGRFLVGAYKLGAKSIKTTKTVASDIRNSKAVSKVLGNKRDNRYKDSKLQNPRWTTVSEDEVIVPNDIEENAVGSVGGDDDKKSNKSNPLFRMIKSIERGIRIIAGASISSSTNDGLDIDTNATNVEHGSVLDYAKRVKNKIKSKPKYTTQYVNGHPLKIFRDKNGDENVDPSSAENKESIKAIEEDQNTQKGILSSLKSLPSTLGGILGKLTGGDKEEKKESWFSKIFSKLKSALKIGGTILGGAGVVGAAASVLTKEDENGVSVADKVGTAISNFVEQKFKPYFERAWAGQEKGLGQFIYFFNPNNENGLLAKVSTFIKDYFPSMMKTAAAWISSGLNWALKNVLPGAVKAIIVNLPTILSGVVQGTVSGVNALITGKTAIKEPEVTLSKAFTTSEQLSTPSWMKEASISADDFSGFDWDTLTVGDSINNTITEAAKIKDDVEKQAKYTGKSESEIIEDKGKKTNDKTYYGQNVYEIDGIKISSEDPLEGRLPKAFNYIPDSSKDRAKAAYNKVKTNVVHMEGFGYMTVGEVLDNDKVIVGYLDSGTKIRGCQALMYQDTASALGINFKLSNDEIEENTKKEGTSGNSIQKISAKAGIKSFVRGLAGTTVGVKGAANVAEGTVRGLSSILGLVPGVNKVTKPLGNLMGNIFGEGTTKSGKKKLNLFGRINKNGKSLSEVLGLDRRSVADIATENGDDFFSNLLNNSKDAAENAAKHVDAEEITEEAYNLVRNGSKQTSKQTAKNAAKEGVERTAKTAASNVTKQITSKKQLALPGPVSDIADDVIEIIDADGSVINVAKNTSKEVAEEGVETAAKKTAKQTAKNAAKEGVETAASKVVKEGAESLADGAGKVLLEGAEKEKSTLLTKFIGLIQKGVSALLENGFVKGKLKSGLKSVGKVAGATAKNVDKVLVKIGEKLGPGLAKLLEKYGGKIGAKAAVKIGTYTASALTLMVADAVVSFGLGFKNANNIVKTVEQPNAFVRFLCGLANCANEVFLLGLVPLSLVVDLVVNIGEQCLGMDFGELTEQRKKAEEEVQKYNDEHRTHLSVEEYNNRNKISTKIKNKAKDLIFGEEDENGERNGGLVGTAKNAGKAIKNKASELVDGAGKKISSAVDKAKELGGNIKDAASNAKDKAVELATGAKDKAIEIKNNVVDSIKETAKGIKDKFKESTAGDLLIYAKNVVKDTWQEYVTGEDIKSKDLVIDKDDPNGDYKHIIYYIVKIIAAIPGSIVKLGKHIYNDGIKPFAQSIVDVASGAKNTVTNMLKHAWNGEIVEMVTDTSGDVDSDIKGVSYISKAINVTSKILLAIPSLITAGVGLIVHNFDSIIDGFKSIGSGMSKTVTSQLSKAWNGHPIEAFTDTSGNANTGNKLVDTVSKVINEAVVKNIIAIPTLITSAVGFVVHNVGAVIDGFKNVGGGVKTTVETIVTKSFGGHPIEAFKDTSGNTNTGNVLVDNASSAVNFITKVALAIPTLIGGAAGFAIKGISKVVDGVKTIGGSLGNTVSAQFSKAFNGDLSGAFTDPTEGTNTGNSFIDNISSVLNGSVKYTLALPTLLAAGIGFVYKHMQPVIEGVKTVGSGIETTATNLFTQAWSGNVISAFTDTSGDANTGNSFVDGSSHVVNTVLKVGLAIPALLAGGVGTLKRGFDSFVSSAKTVGSGVSGTVSQLMENAKAGNISTLFSTNADANTGNGLVDGISHIVNTAIKGVLSPFALLTAAVSAAKNKVGSFMDTLSQAGKVSDTDTKIMDQANDGDISPFSNKYWTTHSSLDGIAGGFNTFITLIRKVMNLPSALVAMINPVKWTKNQLKKLSKKMGVDDSETKSSGSGSGIAGRGSGIWGRGADDKSGNKTKSISENELKNEVKKSENRDLTDTNRTSDNTFVSQLDSKYAKQRFNISGDTETQTIGDTGCAPAAATMAVNGTLGDKQLSMNNASSLALKYKMRNDGVNATYFGEEFARNGMNAQYITADNPKERKYEVTKQLQNHNRVVLMGSDETNKSKKDSPYGPNPHYIVANRMSPDGKYIYVNDPESNKPNVRYRADKVLNNSTLGVAASVARGSRLTGKVWNKIKKATGRGTLPGNSVAEQCWNFFRSNGFTEEASAGIMGNLKAETNMDPTCDVSGVTCGIACWDNINGQSPLKQAASQQGKDWTDLEFQLNYLLSGLPSAFDTYTGRSPYYYSTGEWAWWPEKMSFDDYKKLKDIAKAAEIFERVYERASIPRIENRIQFAKEFYQQFTGKFVQIDGTSSDSSESSEKKTWVEELYGAFDDLAEAYGLKTTSSSSDSDSSSTGGAVGGNDKQKALVNQMKSVEGKLRYSQQQRDPETGSGDCSSTVQWAYQKVLGVDPGSWTGAMETDDDTYTVTTDFDESKMEPGDEILYNGHVEMYMGDGKMIGHGGGADGNEMGPTVKPLSDQGRFRMIRRWVGFRDGGSGSGLVGKGSGLWGRGNDKAATKTNAATKARTQLKYPNGPTLNERAYERAENLIRGGKVNSWLPTGYDQKEIEKEDIQVADIGDNGQITDITERDKQNKPIYVAKGSSLDDIGSSDTLVKYLLGSTMKNIEKSTSTSGDSVELLKTGIKLLSVIAQNTEQLNNIVKLLSEYIKTSQSEGVSSTKTLLAKQNLINAMEGTGDKPNEQLLKLIENTELIANQ